MPGTAWITTTWPTALAAWLAGASPSTVNESEQATPTAQMILILLSPHEVVGHTRPMGAQHRALNPVNPSSHP